MILDVELRSRELIVFFVQQLRKRPDFLFDVHRQVVSYKDAAAKSDQENFCLLSPIKSLKKHISRIHAQRTLFASSAGDNPKYEGRLRVRSHLFLITRATFKKTRSRFLK